MVHVTTALLLLSCMPLMASSDTISNCQPVEGESCKCKLNDGSFIDLNPIQPDHSGTKWRFDYGDVPGEGTFSYAFNPCITMKGLPSGKEADSCSDSVVCQKDSRGGGLYYSIGKQPTESFTLDNTGKLIVSYQGTSSDNGVRTSWIELECDEKNADPTFTYRTVKEDDNYYFTLTSKHCCPTTNGGLSLGSILCIIFVIVVLTYIVFGVLFNKFVRGATGAELIPNREFWKSLPGLIKDGFQFTASKISGLFSRDAQYDQI